MTPVNLNLQNHSYDHVVMAWNNITRAKSKSRDDINTYLNDIELIEQEFNDLLQTLDRNKRTAMQTDAVYDPFAGRDPIFYTFL